MPCIKCNQKIKSKGLCEQCFEDQDEQIDEMQAEITRLNKVIEILNKDNENLLEQINLLEECEDSEDERDIE
jgi:TolA-binding protein